MADAADDDSVDATEALEKDFLLNKLPIPRLIIPPIPPPFHPAPLTATSAGDLARRSSTGEFEMCITGDRELRIDGDFDLRTGDPDFLILTVLIGAREALEEGFRVELRSDSALGKSRPKSDLLLARAFPSTENLPCGATCPEEEDEDGEGGVAGFFGERVLPEWGPPNWWFSLDRRPLPLRPPGLPSKTGESEPPLWREDKVLVACLGMKSAEENSSDLLSSIK